MNIFGTELEIVTNPYGQSVAPIDAEYVDRTPSILLKGPWNTGIADFMKREGIKGLYLNSAKGFVCENFDFLTDLPELELLDILYSPVETLASVSRLEKLISLSIACHWKDTLDLSRLDKLDRCFLSYDRGAESIFECSSIRYLYIDEFKIKSFDRLENLSKLEFLAIGNSSFNNPELFGSMSALRKLVLLNCRRLDHLAGIESLTNLEWLTIDGSRKIKNVDELSALTSLIVLQLSNNKELETLAAIKNLTQIKALAFYGDTIFADGDFSFLESFASLSLVGFNNRRHYTHKPAKAWNWCNYESGEIGILRK